MINLSFAGCGFLGIYHVGVACCFRKYAPHVCVSKIAGASVGSIAAAALICDVSLGQTTTDILAVAVKARSSALGPFNPRFNLNQTLRDALEKALPPNAHVLCSGRLFISVTRWSDRKNVLLSHFDSREELIQALLCSCFIPGYSAFSIPTFQGEKYVDGGMSDNLPVLDDNTVTVSPFAGEHDICPQDESCNILQINVANTSMAVSPGNLYRFARILFPPKPEILSKMCQQGFDDALKYLQRKGNVISCTRCLGVRSIIRIRQRSSEDDLESGLYDVGHEFDNCIDCKQKRKMATYGGLPETVIAAIQDACDQVNKGLYNYLFQNRPMRLLAFFGIPYTLPMDLSIAIFLKIYQKLPDLRQELVKRFKDIITLIKHLLNKFDSKKTLYRAMFSCELSIREFNYPEDKVDSSISQQIKNGIHENNNIPIEDKIPKRKFSMRRAASVQTTERESECRLQRKSYAGFPVSFQQPEAKPARRKSFSEINNPERVIRNMKFGFTVGFTPGLSENDRNADLFQSLKSLGDEDSELNIMELAKKAIGLEQEYLHHHHHCAQTSLPCEENISETLKVSGNNPVMSYCYMDDDQTIKINEIYNVTDADSSVILPDEERLLNKDLQWESNWVNPSEYPQYPNVSIVDSLDDHEFDTSDTEYDLTGNIDVFVEAEGSVSENNNEGEFNIKKPFRKTSFVIVK